NAWLMNFFDAIVFLSDYNRKQLLRKSKKLANKAYVIYNFVGERAQNRKKRRGNGFECLFVGRAVDVKRPWLFIDGAAEAAKRNKNIKSTMIVASGPLESKIKELIGTVEKKQRYKINLHLNLKKVEVKGMYKNADVFVFTSTPEEGQGIVLMEAMQHGLPIICTDHPKFKEFLGDAALYFTDKKSLAEKILKLAQDKKLYREYQIHSSQRFRVFSSKETAKKWVGLFNKLYAEKNKIEGDDIKGKY
ncbi:MAG: glycosyltransferase family 4 protein, partial [Candidatus Anstonellales archaeon]